MPSSQRHGVRRPQSRVSSLPRGCDRLALTAVPRSLYSRPRSTYATCNTAVATLTSMTALFRKLEGQQHHFTIGKLSSNCKITDNAEMSSCCGCAE